MPQKAQLVIQFDDVSNAGDTFTLDVDAISRTFTRVDSFATPSKYAGEYNDLTTLLITLHYFADARYNVVDNGTVITLTAKDYGDQWNFGTVTFSGTHDFQVLSQTNSIGPTCDLAISSINTFTPTAVLNDGSAIVNATTTNPPIVYSKDNVNWQGSATFSGLSAGGYTAYAKDANNCVAAAGFTIAAYVPPAPVTGCTDPRATNYNASATEDDGTCAFPEAPVYDVFQPLLIEVQHCTPENPVMLSWRNNLGGFDHWLFGYRQTISKEIAEIGLYELYSDELETQQSQQRTLGRRSQPSMVLGADNLTLNQRLALESLADSPLVYRLFPDLTRYEVTVKTGTLPAYDTRDSTHSIEFTVELPRKNNLTN